MALTSADTDSGADTDGQPDLPPVQDSDSTTEAPRPRRSRRTRVILVGALVLLLAGGGVGAWALFFRTPEASTTYRTVTVARETLKQTVSATGTLNPATQSDLSFSSSGTVASVEVEPGDLVDKGQELASIDDAELKIDYDSAKASLTEAEESLDDLEDDDGSTDTAVAAAKAGVEVKKNAVKQARAALKAATLVSPIAGKVAEVNVAKGDTVSGGSSTTSSGGNTDTGTSTGTTSSSASSSTPAVTVISNGTFRVITSVSNADVTSIKKGLQATITPTSSSQPVFGTVSSVGVVASSSTTSSSSSGSSTFPVTIKVTGTHKTLLPGSSATVAITTQQLTDVISVPTQAVSTVDGKTVVQKLVDGKQVQTEVKLGATVGAATVVSSGLAVGDQVVLAGFRVQGGSGANGSGRTGGSGGGLSGGTGGGLPQGGLPQGGFPPGGQPPAQQGQQQGNR